MFVTKDPNKGLNLTKLGLAKSVPEDKLTEEQKKRLGIKGGTKAMAYGGKVGMKKGGKVKKMNMQKIATKTVKAHEKRMHKGQA